MHRRYLSDRFLIDDNFASPSVGPPTSNHGETATKRSKIRNFISRERVWRGEEAI